VLAEGSESEGTWLQLIRSCALSYPLFLNFRVQRESAEESAEVRNRREVQFDNQIEVHSGKYRV
jgi:hypothetical protein